MFKYFPVLVSVWMLSCKAPREAAPFCTCQTLVLLLRALNCMQRLKLSSNSIYNENSSTRFIFALGMPDREPMLISITSTHSADCACVYPYGSHGQSSFNEFDPRKRKWFSYVILFDFENMKNFANKKIKFIWKLRKH